MKYRSKLHTAARIIKEDVERFALSTGCERGTFLIEWRGQIVGEVDYQASIDGGDQIFEATYMQPAEYEDLVVNFRSAEITIYNQGSDPLPNITKAFNEIAKSW